ncbi:terminase large subunit domain-containing protein [Anaerococcus hydrogenalis]|uniref:terminase large subunit n=1 Tax=Anaerococcus hydrogenalis TaxID=33029 RepID=UPI00290136FA|nr:terminase large subunit [Anaerococcus hydrogenalis]MDU1315715.1 terminase large subunit [Anaerococcus hydrogenalis]
MKNEHLREVKKYVKDIQSGKKVACKELKQIVGRFDDDLKNPKFDFKTKEANFVIGIIENLFEHIQGESLDGKPLAGNNLKLESWQKFIIYNLLGFYWKGTDNRRYQEAFIMIPRKNGKTSFSAALSFALGILDMSNNSQVYIVGAVIKQALQAFNFIVSNIKAWGEKENFKILDNNNEHSIKREFKKGSLSIEALVDRDSLNANYIIMDELHEYKNASKYDRMKKATRAYTNKLIIGITTAGDNMNSFCYNRLVYCQKVINKSEKTGKYEIEDDKQFVFITKADQEEDGSVDFTYPKIHEMASPNFGVSIRPEDIMSDAMKAQNDPQTRKEFLAKDLNVYTSSLKSYFNLETFRSSDSKYSWTIDELIDLDIDWYGGADLSKMHDLTAAALVGTYKGVDIIITHAFFPITRAYIKADEDQIPLFGWLDDGNLTMTNTDVVNYADIVNWFVDMRGRGFRIKQIGFDRKFADEFYLMMKDKSFKIVDEPQLYINKSKGFRRIERKALSGDLYYLHSSAYEYCVDNVHGVEKTDDMIQYEKILPNLRIDLFDASVFAEVRLINDLSNKEVWEDWMK